MDPRGERLIFPSQLAEGCESLINTVVLPRFKSNQSAFSWSKSNTGCVVVTQGGLAPVGVVLASRNPESVVSKLVLTSPPTWEDMIKPIPTAELEKNFKFLSSPFWGNLAFSILETRNAVRFFSDLFLFAESCDEEWLDYSDNAMIKSARPPVQAFNAGMCNHRSFEEEMTELINQPTIIVSGQDDKRKEMREMYGTQMKNCQLKTVKGLNVLPWESTKEFQEILEGL
jgi:pimeloyl-ACP methyl ester carboxylesterase